MTAHELRLHALGQRYGVSGEDLLTAGEEIRNALRAMGRPATDDDVRALLDQTLAGMASHGTSRAVPGERA